MNKEQARLVWQVWDLAAQGIRLNGRRLLAAKGDPKYSARRCLALAISANIPGVPETVLAEFLGVARGAIYQAKQDIPILLRHMPELYQLALTIEQQSGLQVREDGINRRLLPRILPKDATITPERGRAIDRIYEIAAEVSGYTVTLLKLNKRGGKLGIRRKLEPVRRLTLALAVASLGPSALSSASCKTNVSTYAGFSERTAFRAVDDAPETLATVPIAQEITRRVLEQGLVSDLPHSWTEHL